MSETNVYGLKLSTRCLRPVVASTNETKFLVGTNDLNSKNELHLIKFDEDTRRISSKKFRHPNPIQFLDSCPMDERLVLSCYSTFDNNKIQYGASLYKFTNLDTSSKDDNSEGLETLLNLTTDSSQGAILRLNWNPSGKDSRIIQLNQSSLSLINIDGSMKDHQELFTISPFDKDQSLYTCQWKLNSEQVIVTSEESVKGIDLNSKETTFHIPKAHRFKVRDVDCNPNIGYQLMTGGDDGLVRFWDIRNTSTCIKELSNHSHWVWSVGYNRLHDQLVLSGGSDCQVNLNNVISISSAQSLADDSSSSETDSTDDLQHREIHSHHKSIDRLVSGYDYHEDSVYSTCWSYANPWIFASLSYDGRLVFNLVPQDEKYKILL